MIDHLYLKEVNSIKNIKITSIINKNLIKMKTHLYLLITMLLQSCNIYKDKELNFALEKAGNNRSQLEEVLKHYSNDELKYQAACFLIKKMPYLNYYESDKYNLLKKQIRPIKKETGLPEHFIYDILIKRYGNLTNSDFISKNDAQTITADFLIRNIDQAFNVWYNQPWGKHISFDIFCQEILPYRIGNEPLVEWRDKYYKYFQPILDSLQKDNCPVTACQLIYDAITSQDWIFVNNLSGPHIGGKDLLEHRFGNCREYSDYVQYAMRSVGIPGGIDLIVQNPDDSFKKHYWNYLRDTSGRNIEFELFRIRPGQNINDSARLRGKVYRSHPYISNNSLPVLFPKEHLFPDLNDPFIEDVSSLYFPNDSVSIQRCPEHTNNKLLYLCVFNNASWTAIAASIIKNRKADFINIEPNIVYCPALYINGNIQPIKNPFLLKEDGRTHYFHPDTTNKREVTLTRKFYLRSNFEKKNKPGIGGIFQGSNDSKFKNTTNLHTIIEVNLRYNQINFNSQHSFKYVRYLSPDSSLCGMAEIEFYTKDNVKLKGKIIGTDGSFNNNPNLTKDKAFDNDPISCFWSKYPNNPWVGLEFEKPKKISKIRYLFHNDGNEIQEDDLYELFYFDVEKGFVSLGKQYGNREQALTFKNVPDNAILWLRNYSRGKEERIFTYENNKQVWW